MVHLFTYKFALFLQQQLVLWS